MEKKLFDRYLGASSDRRSRITAVLSSAGILCTIKEKNISGSFLHPF